MDRRIDKRFPVQLAAKVTDLATGESCAGTLVDISKAGVCVLSDHRFAPNSVVKLEVADSILFGCVVHCTGDSPPFRVGIEIVRVLLGGTDLADILNTVLAEALPTTPGLLASNPQKRRPHSRP